MAVTNILYKQKDNLYSVKLLFVLKSFMSTRGADSCYCIKTDMTHPL